jgi:multiple sugar transport system permease protein
LVSVILPQSVPALVAVALFHFMFAWNDFFMPLIYLSTARDLQPISIGIQLYNALFFAEPHMVQATALLGLLLPVALFFVAQRYFMRGIVFTGVEK